MNVFSNSRCSKGQGKRMGRQMREEDGKAHGRRGWVGRQEKRTGRQTREEDGLGDRRLSGGFMEQLDE